jgi:hypothetical protein
MKHLVGAIECVMSQAATVRGYRQATRKPTER